MCIGSLQLSADIPTFIQLNQLLDALDKQLAILLYSKWSADVRLKKKYTALLAVPQAHLPQDDLRLPKLYKQYFTNLTIV